MDYDRREFLKEMVYYCLLLMVPLVAVVSDLKAPADSLEKYREYAGIDDGGELPEE